MGLFSKKYAPPAMDGLDADTLYARGKSAVDPRDAHAYLTRAQALAPGDIRVQRELLLRGELHTRDGRTLDYHVIKCYLLHAFEHPEAHGEAECERMAREIFDHPRLRRCLELSPDESAFLRDYLHDLCAEYMRLFIAGDTAHTRAVLGFSPGKRLPRFLAEPAYDTLRRIMAAPCLNQEERLLLARAFYGAYSAHMNGQTAPLDEKLGNLLGVLTQ